MVPDLEFQGLALLHLLEVAEVVLYTARALRGPVVLVVVDLCISSTAQVQQAIHPPHLLLKEILAGRQIIMGARRVPPL